MPDVFGRHGGLLDGAWTRVALPPGVESKHLHDLVVVRAGASRQDCTSLADRWYDLLMLELLDDHERAWLPSQRCGVRRSQEFLLGRLAAKIAIREALRAKIGPVALTDIRLEPHPAGPQVQVRSRPSTLNVVVSLAHRDRVAIALASSAPGLGVGIDLERRQLPQAVSRFGLRDDERHLLAALDDSRRPEAAARIWAAKESSAKAWRCGLDGLGGPRAVSTRLLDHEPDIRHGLTLSVSGLRLHDSTQLRARAATASLGEHVVAVSVSDPPRATERAAGVVVRP